MAYANEANAIKATTTAFSAISDFDPALQRLAGLVEKSVMCADKINGSRPAPVDAKTDPPNAPHLIGQIQERRQRLVSLVDHLENELGRIESSLA